MGRDRTNLATPPIDCSLKIRGIETQRRDGVVWTREVMQDMVSSLCAGDAETAKSTLKSATRALLDNDVDPDKLVTSKALSKAEYKNPNIPHVYLTNHWERLDAQGTIIRSQASCPQVGERVRYVIVTGPQPQLYTRAEDPVFVREQRLKLDALYYMQQLAPAAKLLELDFDDPAEPIREAERRLTNRTLGRREITDFFRAAPPPPKKIKP
jgi:DNA polymerase elongation subunit (family B)